MKALRVSAFVALSILPFAVQAAGLGVANSYNAFIFGNASVSGGESEGPLAVGGNLTASNSFNADINHYNGATIGGLSNATLLVGGNMDGGGGHLEWGNGYVGGNFTSGNPYDLHNGANLYVGGTASGVPNGGSALHANQGAIVPASIFTDQAAYSNGQSSTIAGLTTNVTAITAGTITDQNNLNIDVSALPSLDSGANASVKVLRVDASLQSTFQNLNLHLNNQGTNTVIFDVTGASANWKWKMPDSDVSRTLFNFATATSLLIAGDTFQGSILAPKATVTQQRAINGNLIANILSLQNGVELHFGTDAQPYHFRGFVPQAVPEPGNLAALALGAAALLCRRRK